VAHVVQFYTKDAFLLDGLCQFVRNALNEGESAILVATKSHRLGLVKRLRACGADVVASVENGRCVILDASDTLAKFMDGDKPNAQKFVSVIGSLIESAQLKSGGKNVAVFGEMVAVLWAKKKFHAALELEELWNDLAKTHSFYLRCAYPASSFQDEHDELYASVCAKHSAVMPVQVPA
jgi:KaiC/GvpD/RAD55 family RecA-like ATPase